ncbi:MAG: toxin-antitoxin system YwqK family antitoxin [Bacteroidota bacterium]
MRRILSIAFILFGAALMVACDTLEQKEAKQKTEKGKKDGVNKQFWPNGKTKIEITLKDGQKHGPSRNYYRDGTLHQEINYSYNRKHGTATTYYENGNAYQSTPYVNGRIHGIRKKYRQNGDLYAEIPYQNNQPGKGLKEYTLDGKLKKEYPRIIVETVDNILRKDQYIVRVHLSDNSKNVEFHLGKLNEEGFLEDRLFRTYPQRNGVMELKYNLPKGTFVMETLHIIANVKTRLGNPYIITHSFNLAAENRR